MKYKSKISVLLLSAALIAAPGISAAANAQSDGPYVNKGMRMGGQGRGAAAPMRNHPCQNLPQEKKDMVMAAMEKARQDNKSLFVEMGKLRMNERRILEAQPFNRMAYLAVKSKIDEVRGELSNVHAQAFASFADKLTPEERLQVAPMIGHFQRCGMRPGGMRDGKGPHFGDRRGGRQMPPVPAADAADQKK